MSAGMLRKRSKMDGGEGCSAQRAISCRVSSMMLTTICALCQGYRTNKRRSYGEFFVKTRSSSSDLFVFVRIFSSRVVLRYFVRVSLPHFIVFDVVAANTVRVR